jgi:DNA polymerase III delta prime subunit
MLWNEAAKRTISTFFDTISSTGKVQFPFLIVEGDDGNGVMDYVLEQVKWVLWWYEQDLLLLRDMSWEIDKKRHTLQVDVPTKDQVIASDTYGPVANIGARDISHRLTLAPAGSIKVVLIEHIQRMTTWAANALLKSFEEPLPWRIIVGTTDNARSLLDTIVSRAFVVQTASPDMNVFITQTYADQELSTMQHICALVWYNTVKIDELLQDPETLKQFQDLEKEVLTWWAGFRIVNLVKELRKQRSDLQLLDALMLRADQESSYTISEKILQAKRMIWANVQADHVRFGLAT